MINRWFLLFIGFQLFNFILTEFDLTKLPSSLKPVAWLIGIWRSEHGGKAVFPTIPKFTYGEQIEFSLTDSHTTASKSLNYTAFAWGINDRDELHSENGYLTVREGTNEVAAFAWGINDRDELHSENGYLTVREGTNEVALTTVMSNGFVTIEEGPVKSNQIRLRVVDIGRISFSRDLPVHDLVREWTLLDSQTLQARLDIRDLPVHDLVREWTLLDSQTLQARLDMSTLTHGMQEHTFI
uniref:THAP4-like heme-binding beta-barrel domain-containing protein n=1 Tax=Panagrolaimus sp. ES5 TaxID=591445 RepID=A0AC34FTV5_9BILA